MEIEDVENMFKVGEEIINLAVPYGGSTGKERHMRLFLGGFYQATGNSPAYQRVKAALARKYPGIEPLELEGPQTVIPF